MDHIDEETACRVRQAMDAEEVGLNALARLSGIPKATLGRRLDAKDSFSVRQLNWIAQALNRKLRELLPLDGEA